MKIIKKNLILLWVFVFLLPTIFLGFTADDRQWVLSASFVNDFELLNLADKILIQIEQIGRFFPINVVLITSAFHFFDYNNAWVYHSIIVLLNVLAFWLYSKWFDEFFGLTNKLWLILLLLASTQFRITYNDPILSNAGMLQFLAILFFSSLICLNKYFVGKKIVPLLFWIILTLVQLMTYELAFFNLSVSAYLIFKNRFKNREKALIALTFLICISVLYVLIYILTSEKTLGNYGGTSVNFNIKNIFSTFIIEAFGSTPLSYGGYLASSWLKIPSWIVWVGYALFLIIFLVSTVAPYGVLKQLSIKNRESIIYGMLIWFSSSISIAFSSRYQSELTPGLAYAVIYIQNFGFALTIFSLVNLENFFSRFCIIIVVFLVFIMNSLLIYQGIKVDGSKLMMLKIISNKEIVGKYKFSYTVFNEKIFESDEFHNKIFSQNFGRAIFVGAKNISQEILPINANIGIALAELENYRVAYAIIGRFNASSRCVEDGTLLSSSLIRANELAKQYASGPVITYSQDGEFLYGFHMSRPILVPDELVGSFR